MSTSAHLRALLAADAVLLVSWVDPVFVRIREADGIDPVVSTMRFSREALVAAGGFRFETGQLDALLPSGLALSLPRRPAAFAAFGRAAAPDEALIAVWIADTEPPALVRQRSPRLHAAVLAVLAPEHERAERLDAAERLSSILAAAPQGLVLVDEVRSEVALNEAAGRLLDLDAGTYPVAAFSRAMAELRDRCARSEALAADVARTLASPDAASAEWQWELLRPAHRLYRVTTRRFESSHGSGRVWTFEDVSETAAREAWFRALFFNSPTPQWIYTRADGQIVAANDAALHLYGWTRERLATLREADIVAARAPDAAGTAQHRSDRGDVLHVSESRQVIEYDGRESIHVAVTDLTERARMAEQVTQAEKMEAVGLLAGSAAHDINNFVTVVKSGLDLLRTTDLSADQRVELDDIRRATERVHLLGRRLLALSRHSGHEARELEVDAFARSCASLLAKLLPTGVTLLLDLQAPSARVRADALDLEAVLLNLVANARDAIFPSGHVTLSTRLASGGAAPEVLIGVHDTGPEIAADVRRRLFQPFFTTKPNGTGLGLSSSLRLIRKQGGELTYDSARGAGTTFTIRLPAHKEALPRPAPDQDGVLLFVDDEPLLRATLGRVLRRQGFQVELAGSGQEALDLLEHRMPDVSLVITDFSMPGMNGCELVERVRRRWPELPLLLVSGYADDPQLQSTIDRWQVDFVSKPFEIGQLLARVREAQGHVLPSQPAEPMRPHSAATGGRAW